MAHDVSQPDRQSIRLTGFDYRAGGAYFITICVQNRLCLFGNVEGDQILLSAHGQVVQHSWADIPNHHPHVVLDTMVIMPNHLHGILWLNEERATQASPLPATVSPSPIVRPTGPRSGSLGAVIGSFKSAVSRRLNRMNLPTPPVLWQRNYYDHIIRGNDALERIREYIRFNPGRWTDDRENPMGTRADDFEAFVKKVNHTRGGRATQASPQQPRRFEAIMPDPLRIGHGYDIHRLQPGGRLLVGGVVVADGVSAVAHSDGDVVIHALVDALFGGIGAGDIGEHFPNTDPTYRDAASMVFLQLAMAEVRRAGYRVANADITVLAERPKLKPFKVQMATLLAEAIDAPVSIKAGTNEGCDAVGRGEAIAAHAVVLLTASG